ncbi:hypothetical protein ACWDA3_61105 [Nonomuraea rubra]
MPDGMRRTPTQTAWLRSLKEHPDVLTLRCDGSRNLMLIATIICWSANWRTLCSRPTIARIVERTRLAKATVKRWVRWLRERGWLGVVEPGSTARYRKGTNAGLDHDGLGNRAALWVLCLPRRPPANARRRQPDDQPQRSSEPPTLSPPRGERTDPTRTRETPRPPLAPSRASPIWPLHAMPRTKRERLQACQRLRRETPLLRRMTARYLRWLLRPFFTAGATPHDVLHALNVRPDDSRWTYTWSSMNEIRHVPGWVRHRLEAWTGHDGRVPPLPSHRAATATAQRRAAQDARKREWEARAAAAGLAGAPTPTGAGAVERGVALARRLLQERGLSVISPSSRRRDDRRGQAVPPPADATSGTICQ